MSHHPQFHPAVQAWFDKKFSSPSPPQKQGWPSIATGQHTLILAPTGSGKTLAAFLWCIDHLFRIGLKTEPKRFARNREGVHTLYISPLKALNNDIHRNLQEPLAGIKKTAQLQNITPPEIRTLVRTGDTPSHVRQSMVKKPPHILITTPESLYLLLTSASGREIFRGLKYLIVDEIHAMCNSKRGVHLSLSLERLMPLCQREPVRIGLSATQRPLERIAAFLGGQNFDAQTQRLVSRPVNIVDCGQKKEMDLKVICPVGDFDHLTDATAWPAIIEQVYKLILQHRTTLVFVNMRAQAERIARQLNELHRQKTGHFETEIAQAHHGSISREMRYDIEDRLKNGKIPAVVATASLELGIDIGSIDLVVQLQSPTSVSSGLQRVGRSGHTLAATSKGRIIPLFRADLDDAIAIAACMQTSEIEETFIPENCLDVLAQQITAEVALQNWPRQDLFNLVRQSYCYRNLSLSLFDNVLDMLSGRFADAQIRALKPRISWDKINDRLIGQRGSRLIATLNGGTIPDDGNYTVYLSESNTRLGDLNEEFAFETRVGDTFYLGNNEWRIDQITHDRIIVSPVSAIKPRPPFWKGGLLHRDYATSLKIAAFRRKFLEHLETDDIEKWLATQASVDANTAINLISYFKGQIEHAGFMATDRELLCEFYRDTTNEPHVVLHSPYGGRVNGAWAIALAAALEKRYGVEVQYTYDDDGILIRLLDTAEPPPMTDLLRLSGKEIERLVVEAITNTAAFMIFFRYNAGRAMLLPRSRQGKRIPLWLQRLRATDLLQVVRQYPDFPILIETYRDCLQDVYDLPALQKVLEKIKNDEVKIQYVQTSYPSPMASGLTFNFLANNLYETDLARLPGQAAFVSGELLAEILSKESIPAMVTQEIVRAAEAHWQHKTTETKAREAEGLFAIIEKLGPIGEDALQGRTIGDIESWLKALDKDGRIVHITQPENGWIAKTDAAIFFENPDIEIAKKRLRRVLFVHGPVTLTVLSQKLQLPQLFVQQALLEMKANKEVVSGQLLEGVKEELWCDRQNFAELYRRAIAKRREATAPADRNLFYRFLFHWHHISKPGQDLDAILRKYIGLHFPVHIFERDVLRTRLWAKENLNKLQEIVDLFSEKIRNGELIICGRRETEEGRPSLSFLFRREGHILTSQSELLKSSKNLPESAKKVFDFLKENGASFGRDIVDGTGLTMLQAQDALGFLVNSGLASCDHYAVFLQVLQPPANKPAPTSIPSSWQTELPDWQQRTRLRKPNLRQVKQTIRESMPIKKVRWFLTTTFAVFGNEVDDEKRAELQARLLLQRYGILVKEWYRHEKGLLSWPRLFRILKRLEWQGEIYRGYFITGLSGVQFALPEAVEWLQKLQLGKFEKAETPILVSTADPALPFGHNIDWEILNFNDEKITIIKVPSNHLIFFDVLPIVYLENYGARVQFLKDFSQKHLPDVIELMKSWLRLPAQLRPRKRIEIHEINAVPAIRFQDASHFYEAGFEMEGSKLVLWPSRV